MEDTTSKWQKRVERWQASGETAEAFSAREGFAASTLRWWSSKLRREPAGVRAAPRTVGMVQLIRVPAAVEAPRARASAAPVVIELLDQRARITVEAGVEAATLTTVLAALGVRGAA
jgi:transposase